MRPTQRLRDEGGQLLAFFAIILVVLIGMVGLILDGGGTFVQRREQQNVADAAAMAAGYAYVNGADPTSAARTVAATNGYTHGAASTTVDVSVGSTNVVVTVTRPHQNSFAGVLGFSSWNVSTTATVVVGTPNTVYGALPLIFNKKAFDNPSNKVENTPMTFAEPGTGTQDVPQTDATFNWTVFCTDHGGTCNADSNTVDGLILGNGVQTTIDLNDTIAPLNAGAHTTLFSDLALHIGQAYPVAIVNDHGDLLGFAFFHLTGSSGGSSKGISGWFDPDVNAPPMTISPTGGNPSLTFGVKIVKLTN